MEEIQEKHYCSDCGYCLWWKGYVPKCKLSEEINYGTRNSVYEYCEKLNKDGLCNNFKQKVKPSSRLPEPPFVRKSSEDVKPCGMWASIKKLFKGD